MRSELPQSFEDIALEVEKISDAFTAIKNSRLTRRAITVLLHDTTGLPKRDIQTLLDLGPDLKSYYVKKAAAAK